MANKKHKEHWIEIEAREYVTIYKKKRLVPIVDTKQILELASSSGKRVLRAEQLATNYPKYYKAR